MQTLPPDRLALPQNDISTQCSRLKSQEIKHDENENDDDKVEEDRKFLKRMPSILEPRASMPRSLSSLHPP